MTEKNIENLLKIRKNKNCKDIYCYECLFKNEDGCERPFLIVDLEKEIDKLLIIAKLKKL